MKQNTVSRYSDRSPGSRVTARGPSSTVPGVRQQQVCNNTTSTPHRRPPAGEASRWSAPAPPWRAHHAEVGRRIEPTASVFAPK